MYKKAQAAMEFLMTYGWAILVVLVAIGALAYFGVLSPDQFLPSKCTLPSGIACVDHKASGTSVTVVLRNGIGYDMSGILVNAEGCTGTDATPLTIANGAKAEYTLTTCTFDGNKYKGDLNVSYTLSDTGLDHKAVGSMTTRVE